MSDKILDHNVPLSCELPWFCEDNILASSTLQQLRIWRSVNQRANAFFLKTHPTRWTGLQESDHDLNRHADINIITAIAAASDIDRSPMRVTEISYAFYFLQREIGADGKSFICTKWAIGSTEIRTSIKRDREGGNRDKPVCSFVGYLYKVCLDNIRFVSAFLRSLSDWKGLLIKSGVTEPVHLDVALQVIKECANPVEDGDLNPYKFEELLNFPREYVKTYLKLVDCWHETHIQLLGLVTQKPDPCLDCMRMRLLASVCDFMWT